VEIVDHHWEGKPTNKNGLLDPIPPGEMLYEEFMKPLGLSINPLARDIDVPPRTHRSNHSRKKNNISRHSLTPGKYFNISPETWVNLQADYEIRRARRAT
jgi:antitoxin HigA-1